MSSSIRQLGEHRPNLTLATLIANARPMRGYLIVGRSWCETAGGHTFPDKTAIAPQASLAGSACAPAARLRPPFAPLPSSFAESKTNDIRAAHKRLMLKVHPDTGGSNHFARQLNEAKAV